DAVVAGERLAVRADGAHRSLPPVLRQATVAAGYDADGNLLYAVYHRTAEGTKAAVAALRERGLNVLPAQYGDAALHAERQLYDAGVRGAIGISRQAGMCASCRAFFETVSDVLVTPFRR